MGIVIAYMVLASQFNSLLHPITVLTILPLSLAGAMVALWLTGRVARRTWLSVVNFTCAGNRFALTPAISAAVHAPEIGRVRRPSWSSVPELAR